MAAARTTYSVVMPRLGLTMTEATVTAWLKEEGAWVEKGQALFTLEHEKATLEIESPASGRLHILATVGEVIPILAPIAALYDSPQAGSQVQEQPELPPTLPRRWENPSKTAGEAGETAGTPLSASPKARALARRQSLSLEGIQGSGPRGMIVARDLADAPRSGTAARVSPVAQRMAQEKGVPLEMLRGSGPHGQVMRRDVEKVAQPPVPAIPGSAGAELDGLTGLRKVIATRLSRSWNERPQVTLTSEADASALVTLRDQVWAEWQRKVSYNAFFIKLAAKALAEHPYINVQLTPQGLVQMPQIAVGLAVQSERGLVVPVVRDPQDKTVFAIQEELDGLVERALAGRALPEELTGGTFTITNLGAYEIDAFTPIINPPECAILGIGRIISRPVGLEGKVVLREMVSLNLSFDHRLVDGAPAAHFLQRIKTLVERAALFGLEGV
jgi:pyruvate dehydrogenase E2 component (dihydrolipoamide acetyltransferase)